MEKFILGKKLGMTQVFTDDGLVVPVTVIEAGPVTVVQTKTNETDGYTAVKVGYEDVKEKALNKPERGVFAKHKLTPKRYLREFRVSNTEGFEIGQEIKVDVFEEGDKVDVTGTSKGKGFAGAIKRHGYSRGRETHGSHYHRGVGALSGCADPGKVFKGRKLPGHMGVERVTVQNLNVVKVDSERNLLLVKGAVPGARGGLLMIKGAVKASK
ncbi:MAG TPA: 50S ribosomal protein L3 [Ruminiclostridium sp.]|jgi:large subunit ribosomal protein L3|uniref:Large ribosomal subunit protein uL3 n=1 Tax=Acetivibrio saccincola TaxID=1677857 RepID=A0A2S8R881_9FIRM|nr:50S ribosomal protein L3 [Acetivibrio saccincola]NLW26409.1 50S ribosomal protein L3 [Acetivibrio saccincola]PQQ65996.1 50S ribosomal protein L3 [Acetivibrio saccincola]HAA43207.1 50S ribosomal protein L3 [Ruminiclostridium sp.]